MFKLIYGAIHTVEFVIGKITTTILAIFGGFLAGAFGCVLLETWLEKEKPGSMVDVFNHIHDDEEPQEEEPQKPVRKKRTTIKKKEVE